MPLHPVAARSLSATLAAIDGTTVRRNSVLSLQVMMPKLDAATLERITTAGQAALDAEEITRALRTDASDEDAEHAGMTGGQQQRGGLTAQLLSGAEGSASDDDGPAPGDARARAGRVFGGGGGGGGGGSGGGVVKGPLRPAGSRPVPGIATPDGLRALLFADSADGWSPSEAMAGTHPGAGIVGTGRSPPSPLSPLLCGATSRSGARMLKGGRSGHGAEGVGAGLGRGGGGGGGVGGSGGAGASIGLPGPRPWDGVRAPGGQNGHGGSGGLNLGVNVTPAAFGAVNVVGRLPMLAPARTVRERYVVPDSAVPQQRRPAAPLAQTARAAAPTVGPAGERSPMHARRRSSAMSVKLPLLDNAKSRGTTLAEAVDDYTRRQLAKARARQQQLLAEQRNHQRSVLCAPSSRAAAEKGGGKIAPVVAAAPAALVVLPRALKDALSWMFADIDRLGHQQLCLSDVYHFNREMDPEVSAEQARQDAMDFMAFVDISGDDAVRKRMGPAWRRCEAGLSHCVCCQRAQRS